MLFNWPSLVRSALSRRRMRRTRLTRSDAFSPLAAEVFEARLLLSAPVANDDAYSGVHDHTLSAGSVLNNDQRGGPGTLTAVEVTGTSHGSLTLNSANGNLTYIPNVHFVGTDSFTYED